MQSKKILPPFLLIIGIVWAIFSFMATFFAIPELLGKEIFTKSIGFINNQSSEDIMSKPIQRFTSSGKVRSGLPVRLKIPKIHVNAIIEHVGLTPQGAMDVPKGRSNTAWLDIGPRPGQGGSAVIDGHYGVWKSGGKAVFNNLSKLRRGDKLSVEDEDGIITVFIVREFRTYKQDEDAPDVFSSDDGKSHLNLITCQGSWNKATGSYPSRLIVFTDKEI